MLVSLDGFCNMLSKYESCSTLFWVMIRHKSFSYVNICRGHKMSLARDDMGVKKRKIWKLKTSF
jgi:hypothetical protein